MTKPERVKGFDPHGAEGMEIAGPRLRAARLARGLRLADVAVKADVTKGFLSLVERGRAGCSVPTLIRICEALDIALGSLFEYPTDVVVAKGAGARLEMGGVDIREFLLTSAEERHFQVMQTLLRPGGGSGGAYTLASETVFVFVVSGQLDLQVEGRLRSLSSGDSSTFSARSPHAWENPGPDSAEVIWVIAPPIPAGTMPQAAGFPSPNGA